MKLITYALLLIFSANLYAQKKSSNNDLRNKGDVLQWLIDNDKTDVELTTSVRISILIWLP